MPKPPPPATASQYHLESFNWPSVARVLVLPVNDESKYNRAGCEVRQALAAELQRLGRFEVVSPPDDHPALQSEVIHVSGRFDEGEMLNMARTFGVDVVIHATVTQYLPYGRARLGLVVQAVSPFDAKVVASVDGLWDTDSIDIARRAREFYHTPTDARGPVMAKIKDLIKTPTEDGRADELAIESPALFQRFVCSEVVHHLVAFPEDAAAHGVRDWQRSGSPGGDSGNCAPCSSSNQCANACPPTPPTAPNPAPSPQNSSSGQNTSNSSTYEVKAPPFRPE